MKTNEINNLGANIRETVGVVKDLRRIGDLAQRSGTRAQTIYAWLADKRRDMGFNRLMNVYGNAIKIVEEEKNANP